MSPSLNRRAALGAGLASLMSAPPSAVSRAGVAALALGQAVETASAASPAVLAGTDGVAARTYTDPIHAAIQAVQGAEAELTAALKDLDEDDPVQLRRADEAADRSTDARAALTATRPTTPAGFRALVRFHRADVMRLEPETWGALAVRDIADAMDTLMRARASPD